MRHFYIKFILHPLFMFMVKRVPMFIDFAYLYIQNLQHAVHGKLLQPDYIEQARDELARIPPTDKCN
jgi:hypothetical protein